MTLIKNIVTDKSYDQLMAANWDELNLMEKALRSDIERHPNMSWEEAIDLSDISQL